MKGSNRVPKTADTIPIKWEGRYYTGFLQNEDFFYIHDLGRVHDLRQIEWLDESVPAQQVLTREQVEEALFFGITLGTVETTDMAIINGRKYMNTNFPLSK